MTCAIMRLAILQFETKLQKSIRMGIAIFKIFIWGGTSSDIRSEITFPIVYPTINLRNENFEYSYILPPKLMHVQCTYDKNVAYSCFVFVGFLLAYVIA